MGRAACCAQSRVRLSSGCFRRESECRSTQRCRSRAALDLAYGRGVWLASRLWLCGFRQRPERMVGSSWRWDMRLKDQVAVVTGAGSGIGRASALLFAREGAFVALVDRDEAGMLETLDAIRHIKGDGSTHQGDVGDIEFARATVEGVISRHGRLEVLMTAAGW